MRFGLVGALLLLAPLHAHRLDEYLQAAILSIGKERIGVELTLTPGVKVFDQVVAMIDADGDGSFSSAEQNAYAARVVRDLSMTVDGRPIPLRLVSTEFPGMAEMKEGLGEIRIRAEGAVPAGSGRRALRFVNRHQTGPDAYLVNCLVPQDPELRIVSQNRNYSQSEYRLEFTQAGGGWERAGLGAAALLLLGRCVYVWRKRRA